MGGEFVTDFVDIRDNALVCINIKRSKDFGMDFLADFRFFGKIRADMHITAPAIR
jgi:hypothetical protein